MQNGKGLEPTSLRILCSEQLLVFCSCRGHCAQVNRALYTAQREKEEAFFTLAR